MKLGVLTSVATRHRYFANRLCDAFDVSAVLYETVGYSPVSVDTPGLTEQEKLMVENHFAERTRQEQVYFGKDSKPVSASSSRSVIRIEGGKLNTEETLRLLRAAGVDTVAVFGTNLVKAPLLRGWPGRMINLHLGLSPYYRGTATNFYPLLNDEPEYVGATVHLLDEGIDSGPIVSHARPAIVADDAPHTIGCKAILAGVEKVIQALRDLEQGCLTTVAQWSVAHPKLYLRLDYHPRQVVELYGKLEKGLIRRYVERAAQVAPAVRLVE